MRGTIWRRHRCQTHPWSDRPQKRPGLIPRSAGLPLRTLCVQQQFLRNSTFIMLFGGHVKSLDNIEGLRDLGFDFGEVVFGNSTALRFWRYAGIKNRFDDDFFLISHGPFEGPPNDLDNLRQYYLPALKESVDTAEEMEIRFLTVHLWMDSRFVRPAVLEEKTRALIELVDYGRERGLLIGLENLSEPETDLALVLDAVPGLGLTLDVGHGELITKRNRSFEIIEHLGALIRHVHFHDNRGGRGAEDDLHLPIGKGTVDFAAIVGALTRSRYHGTVTLELEHKDLHESRQTVMRLVAEAERVVCGASHGQT